MRRFAMWMGLLLVQRPDDTEEVFAERMRMYEDNDGSRGGALPRHGQGLPKSTEICRWTISPGQSRMQLCVFGVSGPMAIVIRTPKEIAKMRRSGSALRSVLDVLRKSIAPGMTTMDLEKIAEAKIAEAGAVPAFKGYHDYPCVLCTSVNEEVVHGIPSAKRTLAGRRCSFDRLRLDHRRLLCRFGNDTAGGEDFRAGAEVCWIRPSSRCRLRLRWYGLDRRWAMWAQRFRKLSKRRDSAWCANLSGTGSGPRCMRSRRYRTTDGEAQGIEAARGNGARDRAHGERRRPGCGCSETVGRR